MGYAPSEVYPLILARPDKSFNATPEGNYYEGGKPIHPYDVVAYYEAHTDG